MGDDAGKPPAQCLVPAMMLLVLVREKRQKLMGGEVETAYNSLKVRVRNEGKGKVVVARDRTQRGGRCFWVEECEKRKKDQERGRQ